MISTAGDLISLALRTAGILGQGQSAAAEDMSDALSLLNMMLAQWQRKRWLVWSLVDTAIVSTGAASYNVGPGQPFNIARPDRIDSAFARMLPGTTIPGTVINGGILTVPPGSTLPTSPAGLVPGSYWNNGGVVCVVPGVAPSGSPIFVDYPLGIIESREAYNSVGLKALSTFPAAVFYDSAFPVGTLYFWPIPAAAQFELHITTKTQLTSYAQSDVLALPPEYVEAALYSLAVRLAMNYGLSASADHVAAMRAALNTIRTANRQVVPLGMPAGLTSRRSGVAAHSDPQFVTGWWQ